MFPHISTETTFAEIAEHPAFTGFGTYMIPWEAGETAEITRPLTVAALAPHLGSWDPQTMVDGINFVIDQVNSGHTVFHRIYGDDEVSADPSKAAAGVFFFPGDVGTPLAVIAAGGGFTSVASIQEAFPHAKALHELGYNTAILKYRVSADGGYDRFSSLKRANEDMARAMAFVDERSTAWQVGLAGYSVWGSSAGGLLVTSWGSDGPLGAQAHGFDTPAAVIAAYPGPPFEHPETMPPYFVTIAADDEIVPLPEIDLLVAHLRSRGVEVDYRKVDSGGHGYGLGIGTVAQGWFDEAVNFWEAHLGGTGAPRADLPS